MTKSTEYKNDDFAEMKHIIGQYEKLNAIGVALSSEHDTITLLEKILMGAISLTHADGGTLYMVRNNNIEADILHNSSLKIHATSKDGVKISVPLFDEKSEPNLKNVVTYSFHKDKTINIQDAYAAEGFDFRGTKMFDEKNNYKSTSFLTVPLKNHHHETVGMLQLINAMDPVINKIVPFDSVAQRFCESLEAQAATVLTKQQLIIDLEQMFESMIMLVANALDEKSPYNGGHCRRVPELTTMIAEAAHATSEGYLKDFTLTDADRYELRIASFLHDCGKITTPEYVVDKATKLETIFDRIHLVATRFEVLKRDVEIAILKRQVEALKAGQPLPESTLEEELKKNIEALESDLDFIVICNTGGEFMSDDKLQRLKKLQNLTWHFKNEMLPLLTGNELDNLSISRGTLNEAERKIINNHITSTINMLSAIKWPKHLKRVTEYAGGHHERMDGKGYPKGLKREEMSIQARAMAIADVFEALTASDRPYKPGKKLSEALFILGKMSKEGHIDPDIYEAFIAHDIPKKYAAMFLKPEQIDI